MVSPQISPLAPASGMHGESVPPSPAVPPLPGDNPDQEPLVPDPLQPIIDPDDGVVPPVRLPGEGGAPVPQRVTL
jgi:hypothetical protein